MFESDDSKEEDDNKKAICSFLTLWNAIVEVLKCELGSEAVICLIMMTVLKFYVVIHLLQTSFIYYYLRGTI